MTLPAMLFLAHLFFARQLPRERWASAIRSLIPHFIVLAVYVAFVVGHLGVMGLSVTKLFDTSQKPNPGDYIAVINRDAKRRATVKKFAEKRKQLLSIIQDSKATDEAKEEARAKLQSLPRNASPVRLRNRCAITGRPRGTFRKFGLARNKIREIAMRGEIPGMIKASW